VSSAGRPFAARATLAALCLCSLGGCSPLLYALLSLRGSSRSGTDLVVGQAVDGSTDDERDTVTPVCGSPSGGGDETWTFVPPATAHYRVTVDGQYDCVVAVYGPDDDTHSIACNDDSGSNNHSQVEVDLEVGRRYFVVVDGYHDAEGTYRLLVEQVGAVVGPVPGPAPPGGPALPTVVPEDAGAMQARCDAATILGAGTIVGNLDPTVATARTSCGSGPGGDVVYRLVVSRLSQVTIKLEATFDGILELRSGCSSGVIACNDDTGDAVHSQIATPLQAGTYFLIVDTYEPRNAGGFTLQVIVEPRAKLS
jgi:hypothetical protein